MQKTRVSTRLRVRLLGGLGLLSVVSLLATGLVFTNTNTQAHAANDDLDLPTWADVQAAKKNTEAGKQKIVEIEGLIQEVQTRVEAARQRSEVASAQAVEAEQAFMLAHEKAEELQLRAAESEAQAKVAAEQAASLVSQMYRSGGIDRNVELFLETDGESADALLDRLAMMSKATERNSSLSQEAELAMNNAKSLGEQAEDAQAERERLHNIAEEEAQRAAQAVEQERQNLAAQEEQQRVLNAQLEALRDTETDTVSGYEERLRIEEERRIEAERKAREEAARRAEEARKAAEEAARKAAEAAKKAAEEAAKNNNSGGGGRGAGGGTTAPSTPAPTPAPAPSGGWVRPLPSGSYHVSTEWWGYWGHYGIDMAGPAWTPIYAAASGTVSMSGWWGGCGNAVRVNHGNGVVTSYCHMVQSPSVYVGQWVNAGQIVGYVGTTGNSTGNHLHYETMVGGVYQNPRTFMNARGIWL